MKIIYFAGWSLTRIIATIFFRIRVRGARNVPREGGFILATNHRSYFDPLLAGSWINRQMYFLGKQELFKNRLFGWVINRTNALPIRRGTIDRNALRLCLDTLADGYGLTMFPEGTRAIDKEFLDPKPGVAMIASQAKAPIVPAYIHGSDRLKDCFWGRDRLGIYYGEPIGVDVVASFTADKEGHQKLAELVMERIKQIKSDALSLK